MSFINRLFGQKKQAAEPMHGSAPLQSEAEQDAVRVRLEQEITSQRARRAQKTSVEKS
jgi:hypothetical protein